MTADAQQVIDSFDALPAADKHEAAVEILRRVKGDGAGDLPEAALVGIVDELFRALDDEEKLLLVR